MQSYTKLADFEASLAKVNENFYETKEEFEKQLNPIRSRVSEIIKIQRDLLSCVKINDFNESNSKLCKLLKKFSFYL